MQAEAARQQVAHPGNYGKLTPGTGNQMPPPGIQRPIGNHMQPGGMPNQQQQVSGMSGIQNPGVNMIPNYYPNNGNNPGLRSPNPGNIIQPGTQMQGQTVS